MSGVSRDELASLGLSASRGGAGGAGAGGAESESKRAAMAEQRASMLESILAPDARERLARIAIVKPDKARSIENHFLGMAQRGQLASKVKEGALISMLEKIEAQSGVTKITIKRKGGFDSESEDDDDDLL